MPQLPDVAPLQEGAPGLAGYELLNWFGLFTTGGTPQPIVAKLRDAVEKALQEPILLERYKTLGLLVLGLQTLPSICWLPLAILWFGLNERAMEVMVPFLRQFAG